MSRHDLIVVKRLELLNMKLCPHENMKLNASLAASFETMTIDTDGKNEVGNMEPVAHQLQRAVAELAAGKRLRQSLCGLRRHQRGHHGAGIACASADEGKRLLATEESQRIYCTSLTA